MFVLDASFELPMPAQRSPGSVYRPYGFSRPTRYGLARKIVRSYALSHEDANDLEALVVGLLTAAEESVCA